MEPVGVLVWREISAGFNSVGKNTHMISQPTQGQKLFLVVLESLAGGVTSVAKKAFDNGI